MSATYKLVYKNPMGVKLADSLPFSSVDFTRKENEIGSMTLRVPPIFPPGYFVRDGQIEVSRSVNGRPFYLEGYTNYFLSSRIRYATESNGERVIELTAADALDVLRRPIIAYDAGIPDYTDTLGFADDLMKDAVRQNLGAGSLDAARDRSAYITIASDLSAGALIMDEISNKRLLAVLQGYANASNTAGVPVVFDLVETGDNQWRFETYAQYRGVDHSADSGKAVIVSESQANLTIPELLIDYSEEANYIYAGGKGEDDLRLTKEAGDTARINASIFARTEAFVNASNVTDPDRLQSIANAALEAGRPRIRFSGRVVDTPSCIYGLHYGYGDLITAKYQGYKIDCRVSSVHITYSAAAGEQLEIRLTGEQYA